MALQSSGVISLANVQTEFGGSAPTSISEYYSADTGVPASGIISLSDFYGKSSEPVGPVIHEEDFPTAFYNRVYIRQSGTEETANWIAGYWCTRPADNAYYGIQTQGENGPGWAGFSGSSALQLYNVFALYNFPIDPSQYNRFQFIPTGTPGSSPSSARVVNPIWVEEDMNAAAGFQSGWYLNGGTLDQHPTYTTVGEWSDEIAAYMFGSIALGDMRATLQFWNE